MDRRTALKLIGGLLGTALVAPKEVWANSEAKEYATPDYDFYGLEPDLERRLQQINEGNIKIWIRPEVEYCRNGECNEEAFTDQDRLASFLHENKTKYFQNPEFVNLALELTGGSPVFILPLLEGLIYAYESGIRTGDLTKLDKEIGIAAKISTADSEVQHTLEKIVAIKKTLENPQVQAFMRQNQNFPLDLWSISDFSKFLAQGGEKHLTTLTTLGFNDDVLQGDIDVVMELAPIIESQEYREAVYHVQQALGSGRYDLLRAEKIARDVAAYGLKAFKIGIDKIKTLGATIDDYGSNHNESGFTDFKNFKVRKKRENKEEESNTDIGENTHCHPTEVQIKDVCLQDQYSGSILGRYISEDFFDRLLAFNSTSTFAKAAREYAHNFLDGRRSLSVIYACGGSHIAPLEMSLQLMHSGEIDRARYIYTDVDPESADALEEVIGLLAHQGLFEVKGKSTTKIEVGEERKIQLEYVGKPIQITYALGTAGQRTVLERYGEQADVLLSHDSFFGGIGGDGRTRMLEFLFSFKKAGDPRKVIMFDADDTKLPQGETVHVKGVYGCRSDNDSYQKENDHLGYEYKQEGVTLVRPDPKYLKMTKREMVKELIE